MEEAVSVLKADPKWQSLRATQKKQLYAFPSEYYSWDQPTPRWILGLLWLASKVHPERFSGINMMAEVERFFLELYGLDEPAYKLYIKPMLQGDLP